jgi:signal transduction histidine kinase
LEQVFTNLISNAVEAMKDTGGTLVIKIEPKTKATGKFVLQIDISDTGPGIPKENQERIFEPFFTTSPNGTGLGLSITKQIVTAHRGSIFLTSFPGGTAFHVQLPIAHPTEAIQT